MKTIEEKAMAYDEALERAKQVRKYSSDLAEIKRMEEIFPELRESLDEKIRKAIINLVKATQNDELCLGYGYSKANMLAWLEKQGTPKQVSIWKHWKDGIAGNGEGKPIYLVKIGNTYSLNSCLGFECDYIELSELDNLMLEKQGYTDGIIEKAKTEKQRVIITETSGNANIDWDTRSLEDARKLLECGLQYINKELEKQGEKPADKVEPKFHEGDWLCENEPNNYARFIQILETVNVQGKEKYRISRDIHNDEDIVEFDFLEKYYHKFDINDTKDGDVLACENGWTCIFNCLHDSLFDSHCFMDAEGWFCEDGGQAHTLDNRICGEIHPATKEQRDTLFAKMKEAGYEWDAGRKELEKIENRPLLSDFLNAEYERGKADALKSVEWSEEDKGMIIHTLQIIKKYWNSLPDTDYSDNEISESCYNWLKNLKQRIGWKPSKEQLKFLQHYADQNSYDGTVLTSLLNDLKKL